MYNTKTGSNGLKSTDAPYPQKFNHLPKRHSHSISQLAEAQKNFH